MKPAPLMKPAASRNGPRRHFALTSCAIAFGAAVSAGCLAETHFHAGSDDAGATPEAGALADGGRDEPVVVASSDGSSMAIPDGGPAGVAVSGDIAFGAVDCGARAKPGTVTVWNTGSVPFTWMASLGRSQASPYTISLTDKVVSAHSHVEITVTPLSIPQTSPVPGVYGDTLTIITSAPSDAPHLIHLSEVARGAILAFDNQHIPFGNVPVSSSQSSTFHVVNTGTSAATVRVAMGSASSQFSVTPTAFDVVSSSVEITANATFSPTDTGGQGGAIVLVVSPETVLCEPPPAPLTLTGTGENGGLTLDTNTLAFGSTSCGTTAAAKTVRLSNSGNSTLTWSLDLSNKSPSRYAVTPATTGSLAAGSFVVLTVTPGPIPALSSVQDNFYGDTMTVNTDVVGDQPHVITLSQTARGAILAFNPTSIAFGDVPVNTTSAVPFQVVNTGNAPATVAMTSSSPSFVAHPVGSPTVGSGKDGAFTSTFAPGPGAASQAATLTMSAGASDVVCAPLPTPLAIAGTATTGIVSFSPGALLFGDQMIAGFTACGTQAGAQQIVFTNTDNQAYVLSLSLARGAGSPYTVTVSPVGGVVAANGGTATLTVKPSVIPQASPVPGDYGDTLTVTTTAAGDTPHRILLTESAYGALLSAPPSLIAFPATPLFGQSTSQLGITNDGNAPATLTWSAISSAAFSFDQATLLPSGGVTTHSNAYFAPTAAMPYGGTAVMGVSVASVLCGPIPIPDISLTGSATADPLVTVTPNPVDFNLVPCGTAGGTRTVTIKSSSAATITWTAALMTGASFSVSPVAGSLTSGATATITVTSNVIPVSSSTTTSANAFGDVLTVSTSAMNDTPHVVPVLETASGAILAWSTPGLILPAGRQGQAIAFSVVNTGNIPAPVTVALSNAGPATIALNAPASGTATNGAPFQASATEAVASAPSTNATMTLTEAAGTVLCQPAPPPMTITAN